MDMFWTIVVILLALWILGLLFSFGGELIHILLVIAVIVVVYRLIKGKDILTGK